MKAIILFMAIFSSNLLNAQNTDKEKVNLLLAKGRAEIIRLAESHINKDYPEFSSKSYDRIKVMYNKKDLYVTFNNTFKFVPFNTSHYYGVYVNLINKMTSKNALSNFEKDTLIINMRFFVPSENSSKAINFVIKSVNKSEMVGSIEDKTLPEGSDMTITEKKSHYEIGVDSESTYSSYKIKKETGEIYDSGHKHKARNNEPEEEYLELK